MRQGVAAAHELFARLCFGNDVAAIKNHLPEAWEVVFLGFARRLGESAGQKASFRQVGDKTSWHQQLWDWVESGSLLNS